MSRFRPAGTHSESFQTSGGHFIDQPPAPPPIDSRNSQPWTPCSPASRGSASRVGDTGFPRDSKALTARGERDWQGRPPELRGDRAGGAGLSGGAPHVTLPARLPAGRLRGGGGVGGGAGPGRPLLKSTFASGRKMNLSVSVSVRPSTHWSRGSP